MSQLSLDRGRNFDREADAIRAKMLQLLEAIAFPFDRHAVVRQEYPAIPNVTP